MAFVTAGYDGTVDEVQFAGILHRYSVVGAEDFKATTIAGDRIVSISGGVALGPGVRDVVTDIPPIQFAAASGTRWDLVVLRRDWQPVGGVSSIKIVQGGAAKGYPTIGTAEGSWNRRPGIVDDQPLYLQEVNGTLLGQRVDLRVWAAHGGLYAKDELVKTYLDRVGTEVNIGGVRQSLQLGLNDIPAWSTLPDISYVGLNAPDAGWTVAGGLSKVRVDGGRAMVTCAARVTRNGAPAGGQFPIGPGFTSLLASMIPAGWRPAIVTDAKSILNDSFANAIAEPIARVGTDGTVALRPQVGGATLNGETGWFISLNMSWYQ